jgi:hypothetical protein
MHLFEMFTPAIEGYQDVESDNSKPKWKESRKTKLTLRQIRKLRKMNDVRNYEKANYLKKIHAQYSQPKPDQLVKNVKKQHLLCCFAIYTLNNSTKPFT